MPGPASLRYCPDCRALTPHPLVARGAAVEETCGRCGATGRGHEEPAGDAPPPGSAGLTPRALARLGFVLARVARGRLTGDTDPDGGG